MCDVINDTLMRKIYKTYKLSHTIYHMWFHIWCDRFVIRYLVSYANICSRSWYNSDKYLIIKYLENISLWFLTYYVIHDTKYDMIYDMTYERYINLHATAYESLDEKLTMIYDVFYACVKKRWYYMCSDVGRPVKYLIISVLIWFMENVTSDLIWLTQFEAYPIACVV